MPSALQKTLGTPELFSEILQYLDLNSITESTVLQQALFFHPVVASSSEEQLTTTGRTRNPLLEEQFAPFFRGRAYEDGFIDTSRCCWSSRDNPLRFMDKAEETPTAPKRRQARVEKAKGQGKGKGKGNGRSKGKGQTAKGQPVLPRSATDTRDAYLRKGTSWRRMLVQQPAARRIGYIEHRGCYKQDYYAGVLLEERDGVPHGDPWQIPAGDGTTRALEEAKALQTFGNDDDVAIVVLRDASGKKKENYTPRALH
ncbi:hypothetical protein F4778DRAFT_802925 [Xylariomycetidae sp. FL2044]|nr:hypothetical protein F4778DRAFT_802925 [Xylariomycetidae sp. FL2044]